MLNQETFLNFNVIYTLLIGLLVLRARHEIRNPIIKYFLIGLLFILSCFGDWGYFVPLMILTFDIFYGDNKKQAYAYVIVALVKPRLQSNLIITMLAFDENGKPLNLPWNVMDSSAGYSYDGFCAWEPVNLKPHLTADSNNGSEEGGWSLGWSMSNDDKELQKLFSKVAYILCYDKQITFDDGEVWNNPDYDKWLATYLGNEVDAAVLKDYYAK